MIGAAGAAGAASGRRLPGLDVLRALAIVSVVATHLTLYTTMLHGATIPVAVALAGFDGVELFFVLSGFLIGGLLLDIVERGPGMRAWRRFLARRWMRTLPVYFLWVAVLAVFVPPPAGLWQHVLTYATFTQSLAWGMPVDNWFAVSWSLAVEEWFYFLFSATLLGLATWRPRRAIVIACVAFIVTPLLIRLSLRLNADDVDRLMRKVVVCRLDAIAYGVAAVYLWRTRREALMRWRWWLFGAGCVVLAVSTPLIFWPLLGTASAGLVYSLIPLSLALWLPAAAAARRVFAYRIVRWVAERSYVYYIVHLELVVEIYRRVAGAGARIQALYPLAVILAVLVLGEVCYRFIEQPVMRRRPRQFVPGETGAASRLAAAVGEG